MKEGFKTLIVDSQGTEKLIIPRQSFQADKKIVPFYSIQEAEEDLLLRLEVKDKHETLHKPISK